jgi:hypothetical protein
MEERQRVSAELDFDVPSPERHAELVRDLLGDALVKLVPALTGRGETEALAPWGVPEAHGVNVSLHVTPVALGAPGRNRAMSEEAFAWLCRAAVEGDSAGCFVGGGGTGPDSSRNLLHISLFRSAHDSRWVQFALDFPARLMGGVQDTLAPWLIGKANSHGPFFGSAGYGGDSIRTEFEDAIGLLGLAFDYDELRRYVRGYDWLTVLPAEAAERISLLGRGENPEGVFAVGRLADGGGFLRATEDFADYDLAAAGKVFRHVAPALRTGTPVAPERLGVPRLRTPLVLEDAAAFGAE